MLRIHLSNFRICGLLLGAQFVFAQPPAGARSSAHDHFAQKLVSAAMERTRNAVRYDPAYVRIPYPAGDVPSDSGVCTDEIIRIYRAVGIDLQKEVHEDMERNFEAYPSHTIWRRNGTDTNIDHRRVPNLAVFFARKGETVEMRAGEYRPGDLVTWDLGRGVPHIGMVVDTRGASGQYMVVHNIGQGPRMEDVLFAWKVTGHFRYHGR